MICLLCLGIEGDEHLIDISSAESRRLNIASILHTHFCFCFQEEPAEGFICQKCWVKVSVFHEFYTHIEYVHRANDSIFAECIVNDIKQSNCDWSEFPPGNEKAGLIKSFDEIPGNTDQHMKRKHRNNQSIKTEDSDTDDFRHSDENSEIDFVEALRTTEFEAVNQQTSDIDTEKFRKKRGKLHEDERTKSNDAVRSEEIEEFVSAEIPHELNINNEPKRKRGRPRKNDPVKPRSKKCSHCPLEFPSFTGLARHIKHVHVILPFRCKQARCVESFASQQDQDDHFVAKHRRTQCPHCNKMYLESAVGQHIRMQHQTKSAQIMCDLCGKISGTNSEHKAHFRKSHEVHSQVQCDICKKWTKHKESLRRHMIRIHIQGPQTCTVCGHTSPSRNALREHSKKHLPDFKSRWKCIHCGRGFRNKMSLEEHTHIHTGFVGSYHCEDCGKIFRFSSSFSVHKKKMHPK